MKIERYDIKTNIQIGQQIFDSLPNEIKPVWAGLVLSCFDSYLKIIPTVVLELYSIIENTDRWKEAHAHFDKIRCFHLENKDFQPATYLWLAEKVAKITYNASGEPAPFDSDSGHHVASLALSSAEHFEDSRLEQEVKSVILLFRRHKKFKRNLTSAMDFLLFKKIDDVLWLDWDPIGINDLAPRDEYQSYVPEIFMLVKAKADRQEIANKLYRFETENMGLNGAVEHCLIVAAKILNLR